jgi:DNA repair protein RadC
MKSALCISYFQGANTMKPAFVLSETTGEYEATRPLSEADILNQAKEIASFRLRESHEPLTNPALTRDYLTLQLGGLEHEVFACLFLDNRHRVITFQALFRGTIDGCSVHSREVVKAALTFNAAAVILAHNHPSGVADPSDADRRITERLRDALSLIEVRLLDHFIIGSGEITSFAERGLL